MTDKEKLEAIKAELHRLKEVRGVYKDIFNDMFAFINSLPEEPVSEELMNAANDYGLNVRKGYPRVMDETDRYIYNAFQAGAKWQKQQTINKACEAFCKAECDGHPPRSTCTSLGTCKKYDDFRKVLEEK